MIDEKIARVKQLIQQREAIDAAREIARNQNGELLIHGRNGQIRERDSSGSNDPFPPRG